MKKTVLSLDIGTTGIKVGLFGEDGEQIGTAYREQKLIYTPDDGVEQDPEASKQIIIDCILELGNKYDLHSCVGIAVSEQRGSVIALDEYGNAIGNFIVWMDKRCYKYSEEVNNSIIGKENYLIKAGHSLSYVNGLGKILWMKEERPDVWNKMEVIAPPQTYFLKWLGSDEFYSDYSSATYVYPLEIDKLRYSEELIQKLGLDSRKFPILCGGTDKVGVLRKELAQLLQLPENIWLIAGGGDGQCAAVGAGVVEPGKCMINIGTGCGVQVFRSTPEIHPEVMIGCGAHVVPGTWETEEHTQSSGVSLRWLRDTLCRDLMAEAQDTGKNAFDLMFEEAKSSKPGANGLICIPTFNGGTTANADQLASAMYVGMRLHHTRADMIQAMAEGISFEIRWMLEELRSTGVIINEIRMSGGGSKNPNWNQIHADILGCSIYTLENDEGAMVGAAITAAVGCGLCKDFSDAVEKFCALKSKINPIAENAAKYDEIYALYRKISAELSRTGIYRDITEVAKK